jgi:hypothetical protein
MWEEKEMARPGIEPRTTLILEGVVPLHYPAVEESSTPTSYADPDL